MDNRKLQFGNYPLAHIYNIMHNDIMAISRARKIGLSFEVSRFSGNVSATITGLPLYFMGYESASELLYMAAAALKEAKDSRAKTFLKLAESCQDE